MADAYSAQLRLMTYNIGGGRKGFGSDWDGVLAVIREFKPDILGLQEATEMRDLDGQWSRMPEIIAGALGYPYQFFGPCLEMAANFHVGKRLLVRGLFEDWDNWWFGNALVARWPFLRLGDSKRPGRPRNVPIFRPPVYEGNRDTDPRGVVLARLDLGAEQPLVLVSHFTTLIGERGGEKRELPGKVQAAQLVRWRQAQAIHELLRNRLAAADELVFLLADINALISEPSVAGVLVEQAGFTPLLPDPSLPTHPKASGPIDHLLVHPGRRLVEYRCWVVNTPASRSASDHLPVVADVTVYGPQSVRFQELGPGVLRVTE